ncbi:MAG: type II toxin-antitoxin system PemK/MazF family toxin [Spirochaetaceae bacterium]|nr:type II toxin-antitoxin system PemK/MazF family toxin [Spirochaetaceae bacterium]
MPRGLGRWTRPRHRRGRRPSCIEAEVLVSRDHDKDPHKDWHSASVRVNRHGSLRSASATCPTLRVTIDPSGLNGLRRRSQIMADKPVTVRRGKIGDRIGRLERADLVRLIRALAFCMGLSD